MAKVFKQLRTWGSTVGPYVALEVIMPGGTLLALLLFLHRRTK